MIYKTIRIHLLLIFITLLLCSCFNRHIEPVGKLYIDDLIYIPQDPMFFAAMTDKHELLLPEETLDNFYNTFRRRFYRVWTDSLNVEHLLQYHRSEISKFMRNPGIGENKLRREQAFGEMLRDRAGLEDGFNTMRRGIMLNYTYIRAVPSITPFFLDFALAGEGYPFDYWQHSTIPIGTPIFVYHENDNWALIDSHICSGWVPRNHIAFMDDEIIDRMMDAELLAITKDKKPIFNWNHQYIGHVDIGTVFSIHREWESFYEVYFVHRTYDGVVLSNLYVKKDKSQRIPIPLTTYNIARLSSEMMGQVYGWGGLYFNRDCSQSLLDLYIGFGILLPRNGRAQAYNFGVFHDMREIADNDVRKAEMIALGVPFLTLVRTPGHIMLYVGHIDGEPMVFHTVWGVRTIVPNDERDGRHIIGRTVITSMEPGKSLHNINPNMTLINRLEGITFFSSLH